LHRDRNGITRYSTRIRGKASFQQHRSTRLPGLNFRRLKLNRLFKIMMGGK
jgi:hypothetical protein